MKILRANLTVAITLVAVAAQTDRRQRGRQPMASPSPRARSEAARLGYRRNHQDLHGLCQELCVLGVFRLAARRRRFRRGFPERPGQLADQLGAEADFLRLGGGDHRQPRYTAVGAGAAWFQRPRYLGGQVGGVMVLPISDWRSGLFSRNGPTGAAQKRVLTLFFGRRVQNRRRVTTVSSTKTSCGSRLS
jgi:hypothetical protein